MLGTALCLVLVGCPGDDSGAGSSAETGADTRGSTSTASPSSGDSGMSAETTTGSGADSTAADGGCAGMTCDEGERCVDGVCTPDEPPAICDAPVLLSDPLCERCVAATCCAELQSCFGDGTAEVPTPCALLLVCLQDNCFQFADDQVQFDACTRRECAENADQLDALFAAFECVAECLAVSPGRRETCEILPEPRR